MKKIVEKAFAITLIILSLIATFSQSELIGDMIYAIIIPSFVLSLISFIAEISEKCQMDAKKTSDLAKKLSDLEQENVDRDIELYEKGSYEIPFAEGIVPEKIYQQQVKSTEHMGESLTYMKMAVFYIKFKKICDKLMVVGYVLLFVSLCLSSVFVQLLSHVDLNCITLWSLTLLYFTLELKSECCNQVFRFMYKIYGKKANYKGNGEK